MNAHRLEAVRTKINALRLDGLLVSFLPHVRYLTGFSGSSALCVILKDRQVLLSDGRYKIQAAEEVKGYRLLITPGSLLEELKKRKVLPLKARVGFDVQRISVAEFESLKNLFPKVRFVPVRSVLEDIAAVKDDAEIDMIKQAVAISDQVFGKIIGDFREGMRELDLAAEILYQHRKLGAEAEAFEPIVASGVRGALPHARASEKQIHRGELVTLDFGCRVGGYHSDLTRTVAFGQPPDEARNMYHVVLEAQQKAIEAARSNMKARALDSVARRSIRKSGYGKFFSHSLGHGLGLQVHELPRVSALSDDMLEIGNVITIEPGIYVPGIGGVRIEDDVVIRNGKCEVLNAAPKEFMVL